MSEDLLIALRLLISAVLGGAIGFQREKAGKPAGLRTHVLICMGACLFTVTSVYTFNDARIAAGVVTGIGFLGAGSIIYHSRTDFITGLTTAATIWVAAGIGVAAGAGLYLASLVTTAIVLIVLFIPHLK